MKVPGAWMTPLVVAQPDQRLDALDRLGPDVDLGLEGAAKALFQDGLPQRLLDLHPRQRFTLHAGVEEGRRALAAALDAVHRNIGVLTQLLVAAAVFGIKADPDRRRREHFRSIDEERRLQPLQRDVDIFRHLLFALDRMEQKQEFVAADPRQHVGFAQVQSETLRDLDQQRVAGRMAVIVVDVLEIVDVEKGQREAGRRVALPQQCVGAMLDHPPGRQVGQFVVIGRAEQLVLEGLLGADVGRTRQQQVALGDANRPMGGEKRLLAPAAGDAFFGNGGLAGAEQFEPGRPPAVQFLRRRQRLLRGSHAQLRGGGVVHQQEAALLVLDRDAVGQHPEHVAEEARLGIGNDLGLAFDRGGGQEEMTALHGGRLCRTPL